MQFILCLRNNNTTAELEYVIVYLMHGGKVEVHRITNHRMNDYDRTEVVFASLQEALAYVDKNFDGWAVWKYTS
jgi:hypothetical protein